MIHLLAAVLAPYLVERVGETRGAVAGEHLLQLGVERPVGAAPVDLGVRGRIENEHELGQESVDPELPGPIVGIGRVEIVVWRQHGLRRNASGRFTSS